MTKNKVYWVGVLAGIVSGFCLYTNNGCAARPASTAVSTKPSEPRTGQRQRVSDAEDEYYIALAAIVAMRVNGEADDDETYSLALESARTGSSVLDRAQLLVRDNDSADIELEMAQLDQVIRELKRYRLIFEAGAQREVDNGGS